MNLFSRVNLTYDLIDKGIKLMDNKAKLVQYITMEGDTLGKTNMAYNNS
jgi:hypothetical protein